METSFSGRPWSRVKAELQAAGIQYETERTRPTRDFFAIDEEDLYVLREKRREDDSLQLVLAARLRKEVSQDGLQN